MAEKVNKRQLFEEALKAENASPELAKLGRSIHFQESSGGSNTSTSNQNAVGDMQIIPGTFAEVADKGWDIKDPLQNMRAGIRYLSKMNEKGGGDPRLAAAGYYGGPGGLERARKGVASYDSKNPDAPNTLQYADQVVARMGGSSGSPGKQATNSPGKSTVASETPIYMSSAPAPGRTAVVEEPPVVAEPVQARAYGPDPWAEFQAAARAPEPAVTAQDLAFGPSYTPIPGAAGGVVVPDFMAMASYGQPPQLSPRQAVAARTPSKGGFGMWKGFA